MKDIEGVVLRGQDEVVGRVLALYTVVGKAVAGPAIGDVLLERFGAEHFLTPVESSFMAVQEPAPESVPYFSWRYECLHVLLWALRIIDHVGQPSGICDVARIDHTMLELGAEGLRKQAVLRPPSEIVPVLNRVFRAHWAVRDAQIFRKPSPGGIDAEVVYEWHYALNWLVGEVDWDFVQTDT